MEKPQWQMTREEHRRWHIELATDHQQKQWEKHKDTLEAAQRVWDASWYTAVQCAIAEAKPVPPEVLAEFKRSPIHPAFAIVPLSEAGVNCIAPERFCEGTERCDRWDRCKYPEKKTCKARHAEIFHYEEALATLERIAGECRRTLEELKKEEPADGEPGKV
jgi:hypothetical protein